MPGQKMHAAKVAVAGTLEITQQTRELRGVDLRDRSITTTRMLARFDIVDSAFNSCTFEALRVKGFIVGGEVGANFRDCRFIDCSLSAHGPGGAGGMGPARFEDCVFEGGRLKGWLCHEVEFVRCRFACELRDVSFFGLVDDERSHELGRNVNEFVDNDFTAAELRGVDFRYGVDLRSQTWPEGALVVPDAREVLQRVDRDVRRDEELPEADRETVGRHLDAMARDVAHGQRDLYLEERGSDIYRDLVRRIVAAAQARR